MKKAVWSAAAVLGILALAATAGAQTTQDVNATVTVGQYARLTVTGGPINFGDADPDSVPSIVAAPVSVSARARVAPSAAVSVTVVASNDYFDHASGTTLIPVSNMTWTASAADFDTTGTMSTTAQQVAAWTGPANKTGDQTYSLLNSWSYPVGAHTIVLTYTLVVP